MKKKKKLIFLILIIIGGGLICIFAFTYAKYVSNAVWNYYLKSKGFYFTSDQLDSLVAKNVDNLWEGESVHFNVKNTLNQTVITNYDINYDIVCTIEGDASTHAECHMNGTSSNTGTGVLTSVQACKNNTGDNVDVSLLNKTDCELGGYEWLGQAAIKDLYFDVVLTDSNYVLNDVTVNVIATSTSPYRKTLSGNFILHKSNAVEEKVSLSYNNYDNYDRLIVSNSYPSTKCVNITWDASKLTLNADNSQFSSYTTDTNGYINTIKFNITAKDSLSYIFYPKSFDTRYNVTEFSIEETDGC